MKKTLQKIGVFVFALAMLSSVVVPTNVSAQSIAELQALVQQLQAQINALLSNTTSTDVPAFTYTRDLTLGSTGSDVISLQTFLEVKGFLTIPAGVSKGYFGPLTRSALALYQASVGIAPAVGYFGPITRARVNQESVVVPPTDGDDGDDSDNDDLSGGEASLESFDLSSGNDSDVKEGSSAEIAEIEFDVEEGDVRIDRIDLRLVADNDNEETDPWDTFESLRLLVDGDEIGEIDLSDEDEYLDEDDGTIRVSDVDYVVREGDSATIVVEVTAQNSVDGADNNFATWTLTVEDDGIRATDAEGIQQYVGSDSETVVFDIDEEGADDELDVSTSSEDPDSTTLKVEDDDRSDMHEIFAFDLSSGDADVEIDTVQVVLESDVAISNLISDLILEIDGQEFDDWSFVDNGTSTRTIEFDIDGDYTLDADEEVTAFLIAEFRAANGANYSSGATVQASIEDGAIEGEGADDVVSDGTATGEEHTLLIAGLAVEGLPETDSDSDEGLGTFTFELELSAFEEDVLISQDSGTASDNEGFDWSVVGGSAVTSVTVQSDADLVGGNYIIEEGSTETFTIIFTVDPASSGSFYVILSDVTYEVDGSTVTYVFSPQSNYDTQAVSISGN